MDERKHTNGGAVDQLAIEIEAGAILNAPICKHFTVWWGKDKNGGPGDQFEPAPAPRCRKCGGWLTVLKVVYSSDFTKAG